MKTIEELEAAIQTKDSEILKLKKRVSELDEIEMNLNDNLEKYSTKVSELEANELERLQELSTFKVDKYFTDNPQFNKPNIRNLFGIMSQGYHLWKGNMMVTKDHPNGPHILMNEVVAGIAANLDEVAPSPGESEDSKKLREVLTAHGA